jgi:hypothetical protein
MSQLMTGRHLGGLTAAVLAGALLASLQTSFVIDDTALNLS